MIVAGNWKMYGDRGLADAYAAAFPEGQFSSGVNVAVFPPATLLAPLAAHRPAFTLGAQDLHEETEGAYTGELSARLLGEAGAQWVLCGHSERRRLRGESDVVVAAKVRRARAEGLRPVLCVGETEAERDTGQHKAVVARQLEAGLGDNLTAPPLVAYEPVWAIGTGRTAEPAQAQEMHAFIRERLPEALRADAQLLYGGSVKADNAAALFAQPDIDGALVGGASLDINAFVAIVAAAGQK